MSKIRYATLNDIDEIKKIIDSGISVDYWNNDDIKFYIEDESNYLLVVTSEADIPVAVMHCTIGNIKDMCDKEHIPFPNQALKKYKESTITVVYKTASTYENLRNNGYVGQLFEEYNKIFTDIKHDIRIGLALVLPDGSIPIKKLVDRSGFKPTQVFKSPWHELKSYCRYCGNQYCQCDGLLYVKENNLDEKI